MNTSSNKWINNLFFILPNIALLIISFITFYLYLILIDSESYSNFNNTIRTNGTSYTISIHIQNKNMLNNLIKVIGATNLDSDLIISDLSVKTPLSAINIITTNLKDKYYYKTQLLRGTYFSIRDNKSMLLSNTVSKEDLPNFIRDYKLIGILGSVDTDKSPYPTVIIPINSFPDELIDELLVNKSINIYISNPTSKINSDIFTLKNVLTKASINCTIKNMSLNRYTKFLPNTFTDIETYFLILLSIIPILLLSSFKVRNNNIIFNTTLNKPSHITSLIILKDNFITSIISLIISTFFIYLLAPLIHKILLTYYTMPLTKEMLEINTIFLIVAAFFISTVQYLKLLFLRK
ncbi:hypothetical protein [Clostridium sp. C8-1-8]|uniref:hypothetical protein n=1 Tax=Clostridium sp. C8-1-8 TaxID=2698831 RepID=UPI00136ABF46|nr:hypothetical protein [Clostridium sp. C8-1-8]